MTNLFTILPGEIIQDIFSYLDQDDSVECAKVCRKWFTTTPMHATALWRHLEISPTCWNRQTSALLQCLGAHVRSITIDRQKSLSVLKRLIKCNCGPRILAIKNSSLKDNYQQGPGGYAKLLPITLTSFANTLTELAVTSFPADISLTTLLDRLPALTHLSATFSTVHSLPRMLDPVDSESRDLASPPTHHNLIFLLLDNALDYEYRIRPLLQRCPRLKFLMLLHNYNRKELYYVPALNVHKVFKVCPLVQYVMWNYHDDEDIVKSKWLALSRNANNISNGYHANNSNMTGSIRELVFSREGHLETAPILTRSQHVLTCLRFAHTGLIDMRIWDILIRNQFTQLKSLELICFTWTTDDLWQALFHTQQQIEHLYINFRTEGTARVNLIVRAISFLPRLKHLALIKTTHDSITNTFLDLAPLERMQNHLEQVEFSYFPIANRGLMNLSKLSQLQTFKLSNVLSYGFSITEQGWIRFAECLGRSDINHGNSNIRSIQLDSVVGVTDAVLLHLAHVKSLSSLSISRNNVITDGGVNALRNRTHGAPKKLVFIDCRQVTQG